MGGSSSTPPPPPTVKCLGEANDKYQIIGYHMYKWNTGKCGDMAVFIRDWFTKLENRDTMYLKSGTEFNGRFNKIKGKIKLKIDENTSWTYNIDRQTQLESVTDEYFLETSDSIKKYSNSIDLLTMIMDTLSKINNELIAITSTKREHIIEQSNKISELLKTLTDNDNKLLITNFKEVLNYRRIVTIVMNDQNNNSNWVKAAPFYNLVSFLILGVKPVIFHQKLTKDRGNDNFEFIIVSNYFMFITKIKIYEKEIVQGTHIEQKIIDYRKVMAIINHLVLNDSWINMPSEADIAKNYLTIVFKICDTLISKLKDFAINKITNNTYIDDEKLVELGDTIIETLIPNIVEAVTDEIGKDDNYNSIIEGLRIIRDDYIKLKETINKISVLQVFNQRYKFKCGKFNDKYHMILSFKERKYDQYLLNPNDEFKINNYLYSPSIYKKGIGPLCVKQKNENGYRSLERCYDYESKQRCELNLNSTDKTTSAATFKRELIDTINGIDIYGSSAQLFNPNSKLHNTELNNYKKNDVNKLNEKPVILKAKSTTTTVPTTTEYIHKEVIRQPPETTQAKLLELPDPIIPDGNYYVSLVDKNESEKYVNVFKKEINNKIYYFLKTVNKDITKDQSYQDKLKNNSIFTVRNKPFPNYNNKPYNFITIEFKVSNNSNQDTYFLRTEDNTNKVIITNKDTDIEKPFNWYFLPEYISESPNENGPIEVYLKPITEDLKDYCYLNNDNETKNDKNLQYIENDATINPILNILLNNNRNSLNDDEKLPIIACNSKKPLLNKGEPKSYLKFEKLII
jgi:hypothetical protein